MSRADRHQSRVSSVCGSSSSRCSERASSGDPTNRNGTRRIGSVIFFSRRCALPTRRISAGAGDCPSTDMSSASSMSAFGSGITTLYGGQEDTCAGVVTVTGGGSATVTSPRSKFSSSPLCCRSWSRSSAGTRRRGKNASASPRGSRRMPRRVSSPSSSATSPAVIPQFPTDLRHSGCSAAPAPTAGRRSSHIRIHIHIRSHNRRIRRWRLPSRG